MQMLSSSIVGQPLLRLRQPVSSWYLVCLVSCILHDCGLASTAGQVARMHKAVLQGFVKSHGWHNVKLIDWALLKAYQQI